jgi:hypothetical protein
MKMKKMIMMNNKIKDTAENIEFQNIYKIIIKILKKNRVLMMML